jgi:hypothetical protein
MMQQSSLTPITDPLNRLAVLMEAWRNGSKKSRRMAQELRQAAVNLSNWGLIHIGCNTDVKAC